MSGLFSVPFSAASVWCAVYAKDSAAALFGALVFLVMAVFAMWFAAYRIWSSEREKVISLDVFANREKVRLRLAELRTEGVAVRNDAADEHHYMSNQEWTQWESSIVAWTTSATFEIAVLSKADAEWFKTLDAVPPPRVAMTLPDDPYDRQHEDRYQTFMRLDYRLLRLDQLIQQFRGS